MFKPMYFSRLKNSYLFVDRTVYVDSQVTIQNLVVKPQSFTFNRFAGTATHLPNSCTTNAGAPLCVQKMLQRLLVSCLA